MKLFVVACLALVLCGATHGVETDEDTVLGPEAALTDLDNADEELAEGLQDEGEDLEAASEADDDIETAIEAFVKASAQGGYEVFDEAHAIAMLYGDPEPIEDENEVEILGNCRACGGASHCACYCKKFKFFWKKYKVCAAIYHQSGKIGIRATINKKTLFSKSWSLGSVSSGTIEKCSKKRLFGIKHKVCAGLSDIRLRLHQRSISARVHVKWWKIKIKSSRITVTW